MWTRWGAQSGNVAVSLRKSKVFGAPGHRPGHPERGAETLREQLWATAGTLKGVGPRFGLTLAAKMWAEDLISRALGSGKVTRVVLSDAKVMILSFESHCVAKDALTSGCVSKSVSTSGAIRVRRPFCSGSAAVAAGQSIRRPRRGGGAGVRG